MTTVALSHTIATSRSLPDCTHHDGSVLSLRCPERWPALALPNGADYGGHGSGLLGLHRGQERVVGKPCSND